MAKSLTEAQAVLEAEQNPWKSAFGRLKELVKSSDDSTIIVAEQETELADAAEIQKSIAEEAAEAVPTDAAVVTIVDETPEFPILETPAVEETLEKSADDKDEAESEDDDEDEDDEDSDDDEDDEDEDDDEDEEDEDEEDEKPVRKSLADADSPQSFIEQVLASPYADMVDQSQALIGLTEMFDAQLTAAKVENNGVREIAKSVEEISTLKADVASVKEGMVVLAESLRLILTQQGELTKSMKTIGHDVELVKSQPAGNVPLGVIPVGTALVKSQGDEPEKLVSKQKIHAALSKSMNAGTIEEDRAIGLMLAMDGKTGVEGVWAQLPDNVKALV